MQQLSTSGPAPAPAVLLQEASVAYAKRTVLDGVSLSVAQGERLAVIGPSGAGKTTMLRLIAGLVQPAQGHVSTLGQDTSALRGKALARLRRKLGFLQQQDNLILQLRVVHNVLMGKLGDWRWPTALLSLLWPRDLALAQTALARVELADKLWSLPDELSGGQQQRVAVARLMVQRPQLILADEPVSALDLRLGREIIQLLCELAGQAQTTLVVNLHTLDLLHGNFDRVVALRQGELFWEGPPEQISQSLLRDLYGAEWHALQLSEMPIPQAPPDSADAPGQHH